MKKILCIKLLIFISFNTSYGQLNKKRNNNLKNNYTFSNKLINESSPYLLQHAHNPVNWYPWGKIALKKAKMENKMLIISIGYSACHWCHVMEKESFEDKEVADLMNKYFVSVKIDREERPDIDQVYMDAAHLISGRGGWPLNVIALPNGRPIYAGTYFPKNNWIKVLKYFANIYQNDPSKLIEQAKKVTSGIREVEKLPSLESEVSFTTNDLNHIFNNWKSQIDFTKGGINTSPKFPIPCIWEYLLFYGYITNNQRAIKAVTTTLDNMAYGGIYDHIGGGFARYSTDADWHVPHFEKMLYDNAQLVSLYSHAWQLTKKPLYKKIVYETLEFIKREMTSPEGGFYSSLDADSEGEEGKYYVWTLAEVDSILQYESSVFKEYFNITEEGNWEDGKNILYRVEDDETLTQKNKFSVEHLQKVVEVGKSRLFDIRNKRVRPALDDKILTSWNALMIRGYIDAYKAFGKKEYLDAAKKNATYLLKNSISSNGEIYRYIKKGNSSIPGFLDDYAFTIAAFIDLYQATFNEKWLLKAKLLNEFAIKNFTDTNSSLFFYTNNTQEQLFVRKKELSDNVIPSSNSEMALNLFKLGHYFYEKPYIQSAGQMVSTISYRMKNNIYYHANWGKLAIYLAKEPYEVAIVGKMCDPYRKEIASHYLPNVLLLGGKEDGNLALLKGKHIKGQTTIYVCVNKTCKFPVTEEIGRASCRERVCMFV